MVGGKVVEVVKQTDRIWLNVQDRTYRRDFCGIYLKRTEDAERVECGDQIWWQGKFAYWTSDDRRYIDREIPRDSYSGVPAPEGHSVFDDDIITVD